MNLHKFSPRASLAILPAALGGLFAESAPAAVATRDTVAIVPVRGPLMHHADWCFDSYDAVKARVAMALDAAPKAIVMSIDSPGGLVSGCFETARAIREMCDARGVELHTYVDGLSASAGYALACVGMSVTVPASGVVGSIGVIETLVDESAALTASGIAVELVTSGARKADGHPATALTDGARAAVAARVDELADVFAAHVSSFRALSTEAVRAQEAALFTGASAVRAGLADRVGSLDQLVAILATEGAKAAQDGGQMTDEEKARAALQAIVDDDSSDEKAKSRAKAALAAFSDEGDDEEKKDGEAKMPDEDEASASVPASASLARTSASLEQRLARLEAERESERKAAVLAARPDIGAETRAALAALPLAQMTAIVKTMPRRAAQPVPQDAAPATRGDTQGGATHAVAPRGDAIDIAMGRMSVASNGVSMSADGRSITLGADVVTPPKKGA